MTSAAQQRPVRGVLVPMVHELPEDAIPYYDHELDVPQSTAHRDLVYETGVILSDIAKEAGLVNISDEPIWYLHPETDQQRVFYGDYVFAREADVTRITAESLLLVMEIVSTNDRRKELKDIHFQRLLNEYNRVPEFGLMFPDVDDPRTLTWCELVDGRYQERAITPGGSVASRTVPGLELRVLPRDRWTSGYKVDVWFRGELRPRLHAERARALEERARADAERTRADAERTRAERLAARLRELGLDPDA